MAYFSTLLLSMFITIGLVPILTRAALNFRVVDYPNERKIHTIPVPRIGGIAMAVGVLLPFILQGSVDPTSLGLLIGSITIVVFGVADDLCGLGYKMKFTGQIIAALIVVLFGKIEVTSLGDCLPEQCYLQPWLSVPFTVLIIVAVTNAVNLADGLDGLAGGMMLQVFLCLSLLGYISGDIFITLLAVAVIGAIFGFLRFNTHPASIFMGDTGSQLIGFLAISLSIGLTQNNAVLSPLIPLLLLGFPVFDTVVVMAERLHKGMSPFTAETNHFHHKLLQFGLYHSEAVFVLYVIHACFVSSAYLFRFYSDWVVLGVFIFLVVVLPIPFYLLSIYGVCLKREGVSDSFVKMRLRLLFKESTLLLRTVQRTIQYGVPLIFFLVTVLSSSIPLWLGVAGSIMGICLFTQCLLGGRTELVVRVLAYVFMPCLIVLTLQQTAAWVTPAVMKVYAALSLFVTFGAIVTLKLTRRKGGFRTTPTDFLIVGVAIVVPNLPIPAIESLRLGFWGTCLVAFFFSVEILLGELRKVSSNIGMLFLPALLVLGVRCLL